MSNWYYADTGNNRQGPVDSAELARWLAEGRLRWDTLVWRDGMTDWRAAADFADELKPGDAAAAQLGVEGLAPSSTPDPWPAGVAGSATARVEPGAAFRSDSPYAPPGAPLLQGDGVIAGGDVVYAGFWKRVAAYVIDGVVVGIASYAVQLPLVFSVFGGVGVSNPTPGTLSGRMGAILALAYLLPIAIQMVYYAWFHASAQQATLGKMAIGIKVVDEHGGRISFLRGVGRYFGTIVSSLILCIGFIMAGFTERKQALHDLMCSTLVVDKWAYTANPEWQRRELGALTIVILVLGGLLIAAAIAAMAVAIGMAARYGH